MANKTHSEVTTKIYVEKLANLVHNDINPRFIRSKKNQELIQSLKDFPEMKLLREIIVDENLLILAGDKRVFALEELGYTDVTVKQVFGLTDKQKREFIAKDNIHQGEWDTDILANKWDGAELKNWGVPDFGRLGDDDKKEKPSGGTHEVECPACGNVFDPSEDK